MGKKSTELEELVIGEEQGTDDLEKQIRKYEQVKNKIMYGVESQKKTYDFFLENSECPTCSQKIEEDFRNSQIQTLKKKMMEKRDGVEQLLVKINELKENKADIVDENANVRKQKRYKKELKQNLKTLNIKSQAEKKRLKYYRTLRL